MSGAAIVGRGELFSGPFVDLQLRRRIVDAVDADAASRSGEDEVLDVVEELGRQIVDELHQVVILGDVGHAVAITASVMRVSPV